MSDGLAARIEELIGAELTRRLLSRRGGCQLVVPVRAEGSMLAEIVGEEAAEELIRGLGAGRITLPCGEARGTAGRRAEAKRMLAAGASIQQVALACGVHTRTVSKYRAEMAAEETQLLLPF